MSETTRQLRVARLIQKELAEIFRAKAVELSHGSLISVTVVRVSPDLASARVYLSVFPSAQTALVLDGTNKQTQSLRYQLGKIVGKQLRHVPELKFFIDDSLDYSERIGELLNP